MRLPALILVLLSACSVDHTGLGPDVDASVAPCMGPSDCDLEEVCRTYACIDGMCASSGCGAGLMCDESAGECVPLDGCDVDLCGMDGGNSDQCLAGQCQDGSCASVSTCEPGQLCCGGDVCLSCPEQPPGSCVENVCDGGACGTQPVDRGEVCFVDGLFCLGHGFCDGAGVCESPVMCEVDCDEVNGCVGCLTDEGCSTLDVGEECVIPADGCISTAERVVTERVCGPDFQCQPAVGFPQNVTITCSRDEGDSCGTITNPSSPCRYADEECSETGTRTVTTTTPVCRSNACVGEVTTEDVNTGCSRMREDFACSTEPRDPVVGDCDYADVCDNIAEQEVVPFESTCVAGSCDPSGTMGTSFTEVCMRDTNGVSCGPAETTWDDECVQTGTSCGGTQFGTIMTPTCAGGTCDMTPVATSRPCTMDNGTDCGTLGTTCDEDTGTPSNTAACIGRRRRPRCGGGMCRTNRFEDCDLIGSVCAPEEDGACGASGGSDECMGERTPVTYACIAGRICEATTLAPVSCPLTGNVCGDTIMCTEGTCNAGTCDQAVDCDAADACAALACTGAEMCGCDGANACECQ